MHHAMAKPSHGRSHSCTGQTLSTLNMSYGQPKRPQVDQHEPPRQEPIYYGGVFKVSSELASKPISPQDAAAETRIFGQPQRGSPAEDMQAAAAINEEASLVGRHGIADIAKNQGVNITETRAAGHRIVTEAVGGQVLGQRVEPDAPTDHIGSAAIDGDPITIGEALEAVVISAGDKAVDQSDAAAITAAEIRATGDKKIRPGGVGETAQSAATLNSHVIRREDMTRLSDVLTDATERLVVDKAVTKEDAEAVYAAEVQFPWRRDTPEMIATPGGVAESMATAAKLNEEK